jgi:hypothetical protein
MGAVAGLIILFALLCLVLLAVGIINPKLFANKKTGAVPRRRDIAGGLGVLSLVLLAVGGALAPTGPNKPGPKPVQAKANVSPTLAKPPAADGRIRPEEIVTFPKGEIACLSEDALQEVLVEGATGKETKMKSHFQRQNGDAGDCIMLQPGARFKVIDVHYNNPETPEAAILEVVGQEVDAASQGAFVLVFDNTFVRRIGRAK